MSAPIVSGRFMTPIELDGRLTDAQRTAATYYAAENAHDADEARMFLEQLGLIDYDTDARGLRTAYGVAISEASKKSRGKR